MRSTCRAERQATRRGTPAALALCLGVATLPSRSWAEDAKADDGTVPVTSTAPDNQAPSKATGNRFVEEIVVTAQKREENLQDVPISISAFSSALLDAKGIDDPSKLPSVTPGLTYNAQSAFTIVYLRGVGTDAYLMADPSVATYVDGIYFPFLSGMVQSFGSLERVEVLKGPQGTLFGRNTTGGAINIITKDPGRDLEGSAEAGYSRFDTWKGRAYLSLPLGEQLAASVSVQFSRADNYMHYSADSVLQQFPTEKSHGVRFKLRWTPVASFNLQLAALDLQQTGAGSSIGINTAPSGLGTLLGIQPQARDHSASLDAAPVQNVYNTVYYGSATWKTGWFDLKLLGSDQHLHTLGATDFDGSSQPIASFGGPTKAKAKTGELQILSNQDSWAADKLEWIGGLYYIDSVSGLEPLFHLLTLDSRLDPLLDQALPQALLNLLPAGFSLPTSAQIKLSGYVGTQSWATFLQGTYHLRDYFSVTLGGRYQQETRTMLQSTSSVVNPLGGEIPLLDLGREQHHSANFSPKVSLNAKLSDEILVYESWSKGYKTGTYNAINIYTPAKFVQPENVATYEMGVKSDLFGRRLRFNAAAFQTTIKNQQVQFISLLNGGAVSFENAGSARIRGAEFDTTVLLLPNLFDGLLLTAGGCYLNAIYTDYPKGSGFDDKTGIFQANQDYTGNRIVRTPKFSGNLGLSQTATLPGGALELAADVYYNSGYFYLAQNSPVFSQAAYYLVGAHASYLYQPWGLRLTLFGENLNNATYDYSQQDEDFGRIEFLAPPRTFGMRLSWDFSD